MVEYGKYLKLPLKPESRKGFLIYLALIETIMAINGLFNMFVKNKFGIEKLTSEELLKILLFGTIKEVLFCLIIVGIISLILWIVMGTYIVGYFRNLLKNEDRLPGTEAFSMENFVLFIKANVAAFLCILPFLILFVITAFLGPLMLVGIILLIIGSIMAYVSHIRTIDTGSIKEGLKFKTLFKIGISETFIITLIVATVFGTLLGAPLIIINVVEKFGLISMETRFVLSLLATVLTMYAGLVTTAWIIKAYQERIYNIF